MSGTGRSETRYQKNSAVVCAELDEGAILLNLHTKYYYNLNETGLRIWQFLDEPSHVSELAERVSQEYEVDKSGALESVGRMVEELRREGLIMTAKEAQSH